jgi:hypothetical protein|tara:strand:+ start:1343 stop:1519 length:177 start_codon:yes stop_codon:yes gene_type:complete
LSVPLARHRGVIKYPFSYGPTRATAVPFVFPRGAVAGALFHSIVVTFVVVLNVDTVHT